MTGLADLFEAEPRVAESATPSDPDAASRKLDRLVGMRREANPPVRVNIDTLGLIAMVDAAERDAAPIALSAGKASQGSRRRRSGRRVDWINVGAAAVAAVVVVATAGFAGVQAANASPAAVAVQALEEDQAALASAERGLAAGIERASTTVSDGLADAASTRESIVDIDETMLDAEARTTVLAAIDDYSEALEDIDIPALPEPHALGSVDEESLDAVASAIDEVRERSAVLDEMSAEVRELRSRADGAGTRYLQALTAFAESFPGRADAEIEANPNALQEFRDAVASAGDTVETAPLNDDAGRTALAEYEDAVRALRDDDERARIAVENAQQAERDAIQQEIDNQAPQEPVEEEPEPTDPDETEPTDPDEPDQP